MASTWYSCTSTVRETLTKSYSCSNGTRVQFFWESQNHSAASMIQFSQPSHLGQSTEHRAQRANRELSQTQRTPPKHPGHVIPTGPDLGAHRERPLPRGHPALAPPDGRRPQHRAGCRDVRSHFITPLLQLCRCCLPTHRSPCGALLVLKKNAPLQGRGRTL